MEGSHDGYVGELRWGVCNGFGWLVHIALLVSRAELTADLHNLMELLRMAWDIYPPNLVNEDIRKQIEELVRVNVEVTLALRKQSNVANVDMEDVVE